MGVRNGTAVRRIFELSDSGELPEHLGQTASAEPRIRRPPACNISLRFDDVSRQGVRTGVRSMEDGLFRYKELSRIQTVNALS